MTRQQAEQAACDELRRLGDSIGEDLVLLGKETIEKPYGWVFFYNTRQFVETRDVLYALGGNGPIVIERDGRITRLGTANPIEQELAAFEAQRKGVL